MNVCRYTYFLDSSCERRERRRYYNDLLINDNGNVEKDDETDDIKDNENRTKIRNYIRVSQDFVRRYPS